jgi:streptogramin lyase
VTGTITDKAGALLPGVPITFLHQKSSIAVTGLSGPNGRFEIRLQKSGSHVATAGGRKWTAEPVTMIAAKSKAHAINFTLSPSPNYLQKLPSSHWLSVLPEGEMKREFLVNCTSCHEVSHPRMTRKGMHRSRESWAEAIAVMRSIDEYGLTPADFDDDLYAKWLAGNLTEEAMSGAAPLEDTNPAAMNARFTEYPVPKHPALPHDLVVGPDRRIWVTGFFNDEMWALEPSTGEIEAFPINEKVDTLGQVRALKFKANGKLVMLLGGTDAMVELDPETGAYQTFDAGMYGHSLDLDSQGNVWFNDYFGKPEQIGKIDGGTGELTVHQIPSAYLTEAAGLPLPYGMQIDQDDILWSTSLASNQLIRFNTRTGDANSYDMPTPNSGPRRLAIGPDGILWIPEWNTGKLTRFDPKSEKFSQFQPGLSTIGPYDVEVNQKTGEIWMSGSLSSSIFRFDPATEIWTEFRWPTEPAYVRHIAVDEETGDVWSAYSSLPEAVAKIVRLQPNG